MIEICEVSPKYNLAKLNRHERETKEHDQEATRRRIMSNKLPLLKEPDMMSLYELMYNENLDEEVNTVRRAFHRVCLGGKR